jgi:hypothetical protein
MGAVAFLLCHSSGNNHTRLEDEIQNEIPMAPAAMLPATSPAAGDEAMTAN